MKKQITRISLIVIIGATYLILNKETFKAPVLEGDYSLAGLSRSEQITWTEFSDLGYWEHGENHSRFSKNNILYVNDELAELLFKDYEFHYNFVDEDLLILAGLNSDEIHQFKYDFDSDTLNLSWDHPHLTRLQISPSRTAPEFLKTEFIQ